jgi:hypothetical protein
VFEFLVTVVVFTFILSARSLSQTSCCFSRQLWCLISGWAIKRAPSQGKYTVKREKIQSIWFVLLYASNPSFLKPTVCGHPDISKLF